MIEIRHPKQDEWADAEELWNFAFGDGPALQARFYELCALDGPLVVLEDGALRSMLALPEVTLRFGDGWSVRAGYVYALATRLGYGGRGWASMLLDCAASLARERGLDRLLTVPARTDLFNFFEKSGFTPGFYMREMTAMPAVSPAQAVPISPVEYNALREGLLAGRTHVSYSDGQIAFQRELCGLCELGGRPGSGLYRLELAHGPGCAAVEALERPLVKELLCAPGDEEQGAAACAALCGGPVRARVPAGGDACQWQASIGDRAKGETDGTPFGAVRWLFSKAPSRWERSPSGWLGLAFD